MFNPLLSVYELIELGSHQEVVEPSLKDTM
jgi:hypothetical protein